MAISAEVLSQFSISKSITERDAEGNVSKVFLFNPDTNSYDEATTDEALTSYFSNNPAGRAISQNLHTNQSYGLDTQSAMAELRTAELSAQNLVNEFLRQSKDLGLYNAPTATEVFDEEEVEEVPTSQELKALYPWMTDGMLNILLDGEGGYVETGKMNVALASMRASEEYAKTFPGIAREDGTLRMTESQYYETVDVMKDTLRDYNLNPEIFQNDIASAIAGDVSAKEFAERLEFGYSQVINNIPQVKEVYFREYGLDLSDEALFAMFVSPDIADSVLQNQILVSSIIAEAETAGASITKEAAMSFAQAGISQTQAREVFGQAVSIAPGLSDMTTTAIARGIAGLDPEALANIRRGQAIRASASSPTTGAAQTQAGEVVGLTEG
tara:strand:- start:670 stop:1824 length:1155 start_codon:yes stop_codon:yes gene_type:complete